MPIAAISECEAWGSIQTMTWVSFCHEAEAFEAPWRMSRARPTRVSETVTVKMAAIVMRRLRQRFDAVSRTA